MKSSNELRRRMKNAVSCSVLLLLLLMSLLSSGQTLGGKAVFNFAQQPNTAQLSALGGINVSNISADVGVAFHNPALLREKMSGDINASFNSFFAGIKNYSLSSAYTSEKSATNFAFGVNYFNYGNIAQTDASGNVLGSFHPSEFVLQVQASKQYKNYWYYGATLKFLNAQYGQYASNAIAVDVGVSFYDSTKGLQASVVAKNMGSQLKTFAANTLKEELPFDLQAGITKRLANAPFQFSLTAHHLHRFNIRYSDSSFLLAEGVDDFRGKKFTFDKIVSHLVFSTQVYLKDKVELTGGYNFLRRKDLNVLSSANGLNGLTLGAALLLRNLQIRYATGFYQQNLFNQFSVNFNWQKDK